VKPLPPTILCGKTLFYLHGDGRYHKEKPATRIILDVMLEDMKTAPKQKPQMNGTETQLHGMLLTRGFDKVEFEGLSLTLANGARYTPDFYCSKAVETVLGACAHITTFYECKNNFIREASLVRLKVAARIYPEFIFILAQKKKGIWSEKVIQSF
jgi:hypothetical protein